MVIITDFLTGVATGMIAYGALYKFLDTPRPPQPQPRQQHEEHAAEHDGGAPEKGQPVPIGK
jgi:hypothetical protein